MIMKTLSISEQMQVLMSDADIASWSLRHLGLPAEWRDTNEPGNMRRCQDAVNQLFTLSREDIETHLATQGVLPEQLPPVRTKPDSHDGSYFISKDDVWEFYFQERGHAWIVVVFDDLAEARKLLLNHFIPVWLDHLHLKCRTRSGKLITMF
jgi:uncharacterized protein YbdZ (MbtH family)